MASDHHGSSVYSLFGQTIDSFLDGDKELNFSAKCRTGTMERLNAVIQLLDESEILGYKIPRWNGGLNLCWNEIGMQGAVGAKALGNLLKSNKTIRALNLRINGLGAAGAKDLLTKLKTNTAIHTLDLGYNNIGAAGAKDLATMLENNTTIQTLDISNNFFLAVGAKDFATMLGKNTTIHTLNFAANRIEDAGAKDLATMLETNTTIHTLNLSGNNIGATGAKRLATMLEKNTTIQTLNLGSNKIGAGGAKDLATMLEKNTTIRTLDLQYTDIGDVGVQHFTAMLEHNTTIQRIVLSEGEFSQSMENTLARKRSRNNDAREALRLSVSTKNIQAIELLLEKHHDYTFNIEKELLRRIWNIFSQSNPKQTTFKILVDLVIQSDAFDLLPELLPHLDESALAQLLSHREEAAALAHLSPHLAEATFAQSLSHFDEAASAQLRSDSQNEIKHMMDIALTTVDSFDPSRLAQQLTSLLILPTDVFAEDGTPLPSIFLEHASVNISKRLIDLAAAAVRCLLERQHKHEISAWIDAHVNNFTLMTGLDVTKSAEKHLKRYADTPLDLQQTNPSLVHMVVPKWYDQVLVQPAVEAVRNQLEQRRVAALAETTQTDACQKLANEGLGADRQMYGGALSKAQQQNRAATNKMELLAAQKELQIRGTWATDPDKGKPQRPTQPNMSASATVAQVKLQAVQQGAAFRKVIERMRIATGLTVSMVKGSLDRDSGLLQKPKEGTDNQGSSLYMSKGGYRIAQKLWFRGNVRTVCDINRALFIADTFEDLVKAAEHIFSRSDIRIVDIKDRVNNPTYGGWSDLVLLFSVKGTSGHIHELQLALKPMMLARELLAAHKAYARARYFVEMLQKCDLEYDSESLESKQQKIIEKLNTVIVDQAKKIETQEQDILSYMEDIRNHKKFIEDQREQIKKLKVFSRY